MLEKLILLGVTSREGAPFREEAVAHTEEVQK